MDLDRFNETRRHSQTPAAEPEAPRQASLTEEELDRVHGGYIGETEKNLSR
jgi:hypothetical protein